MIELPIIYAEDLEEIQEAEENGIEVNKAVMVTPTTFIIPDSCLIRINEGSDKKKTTIYLNKTCYIIDANYENVLETFRRAMK